MNVMSISKLCHVPTDCNHGYISNSITYRVQLSHLRRQTSLNFHHNRRHEIAFSINATSIERELLTPPSTFNLFLFHFVVRYMYIYYTSNMYYMSSYVSISRVMASAICVFTFRSLAKKMNAFCIQIWIYDLYNIEYFVLFQYHERCFLKLIHSACRVPKPWTQ